MHIGLLHKDRREFLAGFSVLWEKASPRSCGISLTRKKPSQKGKHSNAEISTETLAGCKSQRLPRAIQGPSSEMVFFQGSQTE